MQQTSSTGRRLIWDLPTRVFHWALAGSFIGAYLLAEEDGARTLHVMFGYTVAGLLAFRLLWGFVGSRHSRFSDFAFSPAAAVRYLRDLAGGRARDYDGHNPAASWGVYALLLLAGATVVTGWLNYNAIGGKEAFEEVHETLANAWLAMVAVHLAGVVVGSLAHRRNLVATMIDGHRRMAGDAGARGAGEVGAAGARPERGTRPGWAIGSALLAAVAGFWAWSVTTGGGSLLAGAGGFAGEHERGDVAGLERGAADEEDEDQD